MERRERRDDEVGLLGVAEGEVAEVVDERELAVLGFWGEEEWGWRGRRVAAGVRRGRGCEGIARARGGRAGRRVLWRGRGGNPEGGPEAAPG